MNYLRTRPFVGTYQPFSGMLEHFLGNMEQIQGRDDMPGNLPRVNITEQSEGYKLELQAPGYAKEELKLNVKEDVLTISAEQEQQDEQESERFTRREFAKRSFTRSFRLPDLVDADGIKAEHLNGVLTVSIPKKAEVKPAVKEISIG
ncbi:MAG: Hsp20/alpha crystallin family protein [Flavobacteriales bacterium]